MKRLKQTGLFGLLLCLSLALRAQETGIRFEHGLTMAAIQAKAKAEHKFIFIDCFTSWCGPCKIMANIIFPMDSVGQYMNAHFICVKLQMDRTAADDANTKLLYADAARIGKEKHVKAYPTFLFLTPDGRLVHRYVSAIFSGPSFIAEAGNALQPATQYYTLLDSFYKYPATFKAEDVFKLNTMADRNMEPQTVQKVSTIYLAGQKDLFTKENLNFIYTFTHSSKDKMFGFLLQNHDKVDAALGAGKTGLKMQGIAGEEDVQTSKTTAPDWTAWAARLEKKYPGYGRQVASRQAIDYYAAEKKWAALDSAMQAYLQQYPAGMATYEINGIASQVFYNSPDTACLQSALGWCDRSAAMGDSANMFIRIDLLYKMGQRQTALKMMDDLLGGRVVMSDGTLQEKLQKMKNGEKTWDNP